MNSIFKRAACCILAGFAMVSSSFAATVDDLGQDLIEHVVTTCARWDTDPAMVLAIIETESGFHTDADNGICYGLMQINRCNRAWLLEECGLDIYDTKDNITAGIYIIDGYVDKYGLHKGLMAYNHGEYGAKKHWINGVTSTKYSQKVEERMEKYREYSGFESETQKDEKRGAHELVNDGLWCRVGGFGHHSICLWSY